MSDAKPLQKWCLGWGITSLCNMRCDFCYSATARRASEDLGLDVLRRFVDENAHLIDSINYGTGENTLTDVWFDLIAHVRQEYPGIGQALTTNGHLSIAVSAGSPRGSSRRSLVRQCIDEIDVSLDFADEGLHSTFRGNKSAYRWALDTLDIAREDGIIPTIVFVGLDETLDPDNLAGLVEIARDRGAFLRMNVYRVRHGERARLSYDNLLAGMRFLASACRLVSVSDPLFAALFLRKRAIDHTGIRSARVLPNGRVTPATYLVHEGWDAANIRTGVRIDSLAETPNFRVFAHDKVPEPCRDCRLGAMCAGGTKDRRLLWFDTLAERDPYCPGRAGRPLPERLQFQPPASGKAVPSIHNAYLPTVVLAPGEP